MWNLFPSIHPTRQIELSLQKIEEACRSQPRRNHEKEVQEAPEEMTTVQLGMSSADGRFRIEADAEVAKEERSALLLSAKGKLTADEWEVVRLFWTTDPSQFTPESVTEACK